MDIKQLSYGAAYVTETGWIDDPDGVKDLGAWVHYWYPVIHKGKGIGIVRTGLWFVTSPEAAEGADERAALAEFGYCIKLYAGHENTFSDSLIDVLGEGETGEKAEALLKAAFRSNGVEILKAVQAKLCAGMPGAGDGNE